MRFNQKLSSMRSVHRDTSLGKTITVSLVASVAILIFTSPDAVALNAGQEMGASVQRLDTLLQGNLMHAVMGVGIAASLMMALFKASVVPVMVGVGSGVLY